MMRTTIVMIAGAAAALLLSACTLDWMVALPERVDGPAGGEAVPEVLPVEEVGEDETDTVAPVPAEPAQPEPVQCLIPPPYVPYVVQPGDTLLRIAQAHNITLDELAAVNCIDDVNRLFVGQTIFVPPVAPTPPPPLPPTAPPPAAEPLGLSIIPSQVVDGVHQLPVGPVWLGVGNLPPGTTHIDFMIDHVQVPAPVGVIGTDSNLADGAGISFNVTPNVNGQLRALALNQFGQVIAESPRLTVRAQQQPPPPPAPGPVTLSITPSQLGGGALILPVGPVRISAENLPPGAARVDFIIDSAQMPAPVGVIGSDSDLSDGAAIDFNVTPNVNGQIHAAVLDASGRVIAESQYLPIAANQVN